MISHKSIFLGVLIAAIVVILIVVIILICRSSKKKEKFDTNWDKIYDEHDVGYIKEIYDYMNQHAIKPENMSTDQEGLREIFLQAVTNHMLHVFYEDSPTVTHTTSTSYSSGKVPPATATSFINKKGEFYVNYINPQLYFLLGKTNEIDIDHFKRIVCWSGEFFMLNMEFNYSNGKGSTVKLHKLTNTQQKYLHMIREKTQKYVKQHGLKFQCSM